jgi:hypothetical protein
MADIMYFILIGSTLGLLGLYALIDHYFFKPHKTTYVLKALFKHFELRKEQPIEFRISEDKAKIKNREFEVKTIHQKYYRVVIRNLKVTVVEPINGFTIGEKEWYIRGKVDPLDLNQFSIEVRENLGEISSS